MRRTVLVAVVLATLSLSGSVGCSDRFQHVPSAAEATGTARGASSASSTGVVGSSPAPSTPGAGLVRVPPPTREDLNGCSAPGKRLCLVALGDFPDAVLQKWAEHIRSVYGIDVRVLAPVDALDAWNPGRQQVLAEGGISVVLDQYEPIVVDPDASLIVVTSLDMNAHDVEPFIFGITSAGRESIVSGYHMDPANRGAAPDEALYEQRMLKLVTKYVGYTYFHLPIATSMSTLVYGPIDSIVILDKLPTELPPPYSKKPI